MINILFIFRCDRFLPNPEYRSDISGCIYYITHHPQRLPKMSRNGCDNEVILAVKIYPILLQLRYIMIVTRYFKITDKTMIMYLNEIYLILFTVNVT